MIDVYIVDDHKLVVESLGRIIDESDMSRVAGIERVCKGELFLCEEIDLLLKEKKDTNVVWLTNREKQILKYTSQGFTVMEIANLLCRDTETIRHHRK